MFEEKRKKLSKHALETDLTSCVTEEELFEIINEGKFCTAPFFLQVQIDIGGTLYSEPQENL